MGPLCRCGDPAATHANGRAVLCHRCQRPLCSWHYTVRPGVAGERTECHPNCAHALTGSSFQDYLTARERERRTR